MSCRTSEPSSTPGTDLWNHWSNFCFECIGEDVLIEAYEPVFDEPIPAGQQEYVLERCPIDHREELMAYYKMQSNIDKLSDYGMTLADFAQYPRIPCQSMQECHLCGCFLLLFI
jgi:hypothetical protein